MYSVFHVNEKTEIIKIALKFICNDIASIDLDKQYYTVWWISLSNSTSWQRLYLQETGQQHSIFFVFTYKPGTEYYVLMGIYNGLTIGVMIMNQYLQWTPLLMRSNSDLWASKVLNDAVARRTASTISPHMELAKILHVRIASVV